MNIILASGSPRRREILTMAGIPFTVVTSDIEEQVPPGLSVEETVMSLARQKAEAVFKDHPGCCVIGADTVVYLDGEILGKPHTPENAAAFLSRMQGRQHSVYTGLVVLTDKGADVRFDRTEVTFAPMTREEIEWYVSTGEPLDKAGAYGVQGPAGLFVQKIEGVYFNVVGLPLPLLYVMLKDAGVLKCGPVPV